MDVICKPVIFPCVFFTFLLVVAAFFSCIVLAHGFTFPSHLSASLSTHWQLDIAIRASNQISLNSFSPIIRGITVWPTPTTSTRSPASARFLSSVSGDGGKPDDGAAAQGEKGNDDNANVVAEIQVGLSKTGAKIDAVERGIQAAEEKAEAAAAEGNREERDYWREEKKQLREKEKQLREKEQQLLEKELVLLKWSGAPVLRKQDQPGPRTDCNIKLVKAQRTGKGASTFAGGGTIQGFAYLPLSARFDPTLKRHIHRQLIPVPDATPSQGLVPAVGFGAELTPLGEEEHIKPVLHPWLTANGLALSTKLTEQEQMGFVTGTVDAYKADSFGRKGAILEIKGAEQTLMYALRQASLYSSGIAMAQYARDVAPQDICIPVAAVNGFSMQFGATFMLPPSLPVFMTISKVFDLTTEAENLEAKRYFDCFLTKGATEPTVTRALGRRLERNSETEMVLDCNQHWVKELTPDVFDRGLGMFAVEECNYEIRLAKGLEHMIRCLNRLYADETARTMVVFPMCIISGGAKAVEEGDDTVQERTRECTFPMLVYPNMILEGFAVGVPHHGTETFEAYLRAVEKAVDAVHAAGVVHLDLYVSNIMHRVQGGTIEIKIIDWDAAHLIGEPPGSDRVKSALRGHRNRGATVVGVGHDREYVAALRKEGTAQIWQRLAVGNSKSDLDDAFFELLNL